MQCLMGVQFLTLARLLHPIIYRSHGFCQLQDGIDAIVLNWNIVLQLATECIMLLTKSVRGVHRVQLLTYTSW